MKRTIESHNVIIANIRAWIGAVDCDSYKYFPKLIKEEDFHFAIDAGLILFPNVEKCQKACDYDNFR